MTVQTTREESLRLVQRLMAEWYKLELSAERVAPFSGGAVESRRFELQGLLDAAWDEFEARWVPEISLKFSRARPMSEA